MKQAEVVFLDRYFAYLSSFYGTCVWSVVAQHWDHQLCVDDAQSLPCEFRDHSDGDWCLGWWCLAADLTGDGARSSWCEGSFSHRLQTSCAQRDPVVDGADITRSWCLPTQYVGEQYDRLVTREGFDHLYLLLQSFDGAAAWGDRRRICDSQLTDTLGKSGQ